MCFELHSSFFFFSFFLLWGVGVGRIITRTPRWVLSHLVILTSSQLFTGLCLAPKTIPTWSFAYLPASLSMACFFPEKHDLAGSWSPIICMKGPQSCLRRAGRAVLPRAVKAGNNFHIHFIFFLYWNLWVEAGSKEQSVYLIPWMVVGLGIWVCLPSSTDQSWRQGPARWCESPVLCGCRLILPPRSLCPGLPAPQKHLLLNAYFWTLSHHCGLRLMFGFMRRKKGPEWNIPDLVSCQLKPLFPVLPKWELFLVGFSEILPLLTTLCISLQKGSCQLIPRILYQVRLNCFVFLEVCNMRLRKSPRFFVGWCFPWCILFYSFQWALEGDFYKPTNTLLFLGCSQSTFGGYTSS